MKEDLTTLKEYLKDKNICLLGNASSVLKKERDIDDTYDVVCRCNRGYPTNKEKYIGRRTDVLFLSTKANIEFFKPKYILWMTINTRLAYPIVHRTAFQNPHKDWTDLQAKFLEMAKIQYKKEYGDIKQKGFDKHLRPTTGAMAVNFLNKYVDFKSLDLIGFDFFETKTWYNSNWCLRNHTPELEKKFIISIMNNNPKIKLL